MIRDYSFEDAASIENKNAFGLFRVAWNIARIQQQVDHLNNRVDYLDESKQTILSKLKEMQDQLAKVFKVNRHTLFILGIVLNHYQRFSARTKSSFQLSFLMKHSCLLFISLLLHRMLFLKDAVDLVKMGGKRSKAVALVMHVSTIGLIHRGLLKLLSDYFPL